MSTRCLRLALAALATCLFGVPLQAAWNAQLRIFVPAAGQVVLYDSPSCRGEPYVVLQVGRTYADFRQLAAGGGTWNDRASCVDVGPNTRLVVYQNINYGGSTKTYQPGYATLCGDWWDNSFSSARAQ